MIVARRSVDHTLFQAKSGDCPKEPEKEPHWGDLLGLNP
jgi:hypothetical protein